MTVNIELNLSGGRPRNDNVVPVRSFLSYSKFDLFFSFEDASASKRKYSHGKMSSMKRNTL